MVKVWFPCAVISLWTPQLPLKPSSKILNHPRPVTSVTCASGTLRRERRSILRLPQLLDYVLCHVRNERTQVTGVNGISWIRGCPAIGLQYVVPLSSNLGTRWYIDDGLTIRSYQRIRAAIADHRGVSDVGDRTVVLVSHSCSV